MSSSPAHQRLKISLVTPAGRGSRSGNRVTATRVAKLLRDLGHSVTVTESYDGKPADAMIAIHAWRSAQSITRFRDRHPERPLILLLAGTDVYRYQHTHRDTTLKAMAAADHLIGIHELVAKDIPVRFAEKLRIILQSATPMPRPRQPPKGTFDVYVVGHLRDEKDPLRAAMASRKLPEDSRIRVIALGRALDAVWKQRATAEMEGNPRFIWRGEIPQAEVRRRLSRAHLMVISSIMEGGANVVSQAIATGLPTIATAIPGNMGLLGQEHPAYYPPEDSDQLSALLGRAETDSDFVTAIENSMRARAHRFTPERERESWRDLFSHLS